MMLNTKLGFYVLDEASQENKLIAESYIVLKSDVQVESRMNAKSNERTTAKENAISPPHWNSNSNVPKQS
jgi:hypothetical protein